ncbi:unnamed protein product [Eruca vesicaria subsp. sativa]|uniref:H15 domain-containing protein n=1 Tax=Eruca vesicaria subsp. sativa TaxID=29727 RepID=A0ABC8K3I8_ERUVS|nr:unnamed protein product [Eruca vesicaria subsp. sativa]
MDPSHSHQPFDCTSTYVPEGVTAQNISPLATLTPNESNRVEAQVETQVQPEAQPQAPSEAALVQGQPSSNHRAYTDMIYDALVAWKDPAGSTQCAISRYIKMLNPNNLPDSHDGLLTHHLNVMEEFDILTKVNNSYKLDDSSPPVENVAVAAAAVDAGPEAASGSGPLDPGAAAVDTGMVTASGSEIPPTYTSSLATVAVSPPVSASQPQKRGRGRPPKPKTVAPQQQEPIDAQPISQVLPPSINVEPIDAQPISQVLPPSINVEPIAVQPSGEQPELPVTNPTQESAKRRSGSPRKDGSGPSGSTANLAVTMKRRGTAILAQGAGRERKLTAIPAPPVSVIPAGSGGTAILAQAAGVEEAMAVAAVMKRGPGRPPKRGRGRGRTAGRPIQDTQRPVTRATGTTQKPSYGELKRKIELANEKVKEILNLLDAGIITRNNQAAVQARQEMEELIQMMTVERQTMEEGQTEGQAPLFEAETQGMELGQGSGGGGEQAQIQTQPQPQTMIQPEPQILPEFESLADIEPLPNLEPLTLTQPQPQILPPLQPNAEAEDMDQDIFLFPK